MIQNTRPTATKKSTTAERRSIMRKRVSAPGSTSAKLRRFEKRSIPLRSSR